MGTFVTYEQIKKIQEEKNNMKGLVGGHFDLLHIGQVEFLKKCKEKCDILIVYVHNDKSTRNIKGSSRPYVSAYERAMLLSNLIHVDYVFINPFEIDINCVNECDEILLQDINANNYYCVTDEYKSDSRIKHLKMKFPNINIIELNKQSLTISTSIIEKNFLKKEDNLKKQYVGNFKGIALVDKAKYKETFYELDKLSQNTDCNLGKVAALIEKDSEIILEASNLKAKNASCWCELMKNEDINFDNHLPCSALHAEEMLIINALKKNIDLSGTTLYTMVAPCFHCAKLIVHSGIKSVIYYKEYNESTGINFLLGNNVEVMKYIGKV